MNKQQRDRFNMLMTVQAHFNKNTAVWAANVPITTIKTQLDAFVTDIFALQGITIMDNTGIVVSKKMQRKALEKSALAISQGLSAYYAMQGNAEMRNTVYFAPSTLQLSTEAALVGHCNRLHQLATAQLAALAPFNITAASLSSFLADTQAFNTIITAPAEAKTKRINANKAVAQKLIEAMQLVTNVLDFLVPTMPASADSFKAVYKNVRNIHRSATFRRSLYTICIDASTKQPIAGAILRIAAKKIKRTTGTKGQNYIQNLAAGHYLLEVSKPGYYSITQDVTIVAKKMCKVVVEMVAE